MDATRFDALTRHVARAASRRQTLQSLAAGLILHFQPVAQDAAAACAGLNAKCGKSKGKKGKKGKKGTKCCAGLACNGGRCRCASDSKPCQGQCIPADACCSEVDCAGNACLDGVCQPCVPGFKQCLLTCIPEDDCCLCLGGKVCQNGQCVCPAGTTECSNSICRANGAGGCCANADCTSGKTCQSGTCRCPAGQEEIRGRCARSCAAGQSCGSEFCSCLDGPEFSDICAVPISCVFGTCDRNSDCFSGGVCAFVGCADGRGRCTNTCGVASAGRERDGGRRERRSARKDRK